MIQLTINDQAIELDNKSKVQLTAHNPAFDDVLVSRAYSFPFTVPASGTNMHALGHINRLDARLTKTTLPARVRLGGGAEWLGVVEIGSITAERVELVFKNKPRVISDEMKSKKIKDILGSIELPDYGIKAKYEIKLLPLAGGITEYAIYFAGKRYHTATPTPPFAAVSLAGMINVDWPGVASHDNYAVGILTIEPTVSIIQFAIELEVPALWQIVSAPTYFGDVASTSFRSWINTLGTMPSEQIVFPYVHAPKFFSDKDGTSKNVRYSGQINTNRDALHTIDARQAEPFADTGYRGVHVPFLRVSYILDKIAEALSLSDWSINDYARADFERMVIWNNVPLEAFVKEYEVIPSQGPGALSYEFSTHSFYWMIYARTIDLANHAPDINIADFIKFICALFNAHVDISGGDLRFVAKQKQIINAQRDVTEFVASSYEYSPKAGNEVKLVWKINEKNDPYPVPVDQLLSIGNGEEIEVAAPLSDITINGLEGDLSMCVTYYAAQSEMLQVSGPTSELRTMLVVDNVIQPENYTHYLSTTHYAFDAMGNQISPFAIEWVDTEFDGLYKLWYKLWMPILRARDATFYLFMPLHRISTLQDWINARMLLRLSMGQVTILPTSIEVEEGAGLQGLMKIEAKIY